MHKCFEEPIRKYEWNKEFLNYGLLRVTKIIYFKNKGANRCKIPYVYDIEIADNHNFIIGTKTGSKQIDYIDGPIVSNCHHIGAEVFGRSLFKVVTRYMLGLSATMRRKDGLTKVFKWFLGDIVFTKKRDGDDKVLVQGIYYTNNDPEFSETVRNYRGDVQYSSMIKKICEFNRRSEFIIKILQETLIKKKGQQVMILAHNKNLLKYLYDAIQYRKIASVGYYIGGMKEKDLKLSEKKEIILATYAMAAEALDIKMLSILIMATPRTDVEQAVGRILRQKDADRLVIDIIDQHPVFRRQWIKRQRFYKRNKYTIVTTDIIGFEKKEWQTTLCKEKKPDLSNKMFQGKCFIMD